VCSSCSFPEGIVDRMKICCSFRQSQIFSSSLWWSKVRDQPVVLQISVNSVSCILDTAGPGEPWDPLQHMVLFDHRPHRITKLIHNSQEPSYFGCLLREENKAACYVFRCQDQLKVRRHFWISIWNLDWFINMDWLMRTSNSLKCDSKQCHTILCGLWQ